MLIHHPKLISLLNSTIPPHAIQLISLYKVCSKIKEPSSTSVHLFLNEIFSVFQNFPLSHCQLSEHWLHFMFWSWTTKKEISQFPPSLNKMLVKQIPSVKSASWTGTPLGQSPVMPTKEFILSFNGIRLQACTLEPWMELLNKAEEWKCQAPRASCAVSWSPLSAYSTKLKALVWKSYKRKAIRSNCP